MNERAKEEHARIGIMEAVAKHTVLLDAPLPKHPNWGTGSLLKIKDRLFIATCRHVISPKYPDKNIRVLYKGTDPLKWMEKEKIKNYPLHKIHKEISRTYPFEIPVVDRFYSSESDDLLLIELAPSFETVNGSEFFELSEMRNPEVDMSVYLMGFSQELTKEVMKDRFGMFGYFEATNIVEKKISTRDFDPTKHFLTDFTFTEETVDPRGLSGCGVWTRLPSGPKVWTPNLRLIGIQHGFFKKSQVLVSTRVERLLELIT